MEGSVATVMRTGRTGNVFSESHVLATTRAAHRQSPWIIHMAGFNIQFCGKVTSTEDLFAIFFIYFLANKLRKAAPLKSWMLNNDVKMVE